MLLNILQYTGQLSSIKKKYAAPNVNSADAEKPCFSAVVKPIKHTQTDIFLSNSVKNSDAAWPSGGDHRCG